jgi:hypothetical protein
MAAWTDDELTRIGDAEALQLASRRPDGTLRPYVTMWVVRAGDDLNVRSAYGPDNPWYRRAKASGTGRIRASGVERNVTFGKAPEGVHAAVDAAYHAKIRPPRPADRRHRRRPPRPSRHRAPDPAPRGGSMQKRMWERAALRSRLWDPAAWG